MLLLAALALLGRPVDAGGGKPAKPVPPPAAKPAAPSAGGRGARDEAAIEASLDWLVAHQSKGGGWEAAGFSSTCDGSPNEKGPTGAGKPAYDVGVTGLALLALLGAGVTDHDDSVRGKSLAAGLEYLRSVQDAEGCFGPRGFGHFVYNHAIAAQAMIHGHGVAGSDRYRASAQKALDFIEVARNPYFAWRYGVKPGDNDTSLTGWMMQPLKSAVLVNNADRREHRPESFRVEMEAFEGIKAWLDKMTDPKTGRVGYQQRGTGPARPTELVDRFPNDLSEAMTAVAMLGRVFLGEDPKTSEPIQKGAALLGALPPRWDPAGGSIDFIYWYYGTHALFQAKGPAWDRWLEAMGPAILDHQRTDTDRCAYKGSWDPADVWGVDGGRVYATAILTLCVELRNRWLKVYGK